MDYDFRNRASSPYDGQPPPYRPPPPPSMSSPMYPSPMYPRVGQPAAPPGRHPSSHHQTSAPSPSSSGLSIRVSLKPEIRITPPPQLSPLVGEIPRSNFQFDFDFEKKVLAEAEKESQNWGSFGVDILRSKHTESTSSMGSGTDPVVRKYLASGLNPEAVPLAIANYGDNPTKVQEFVNGYTLLREMGFSSGSVAEALLMYDNDKDRALAHFLNNSS